MKQHIITRTAILKKARSGSIISSSLKIFLIITISIEPNLVMYSMESEEERMSNVTKIINEHTSKDFRDINEIIVDLVNHIEKLEYRILDLEETVDMLRSEYESEHDPYR